MHKRTPVDVVGLVILLHGDPYVTYIQVHRMRVRASMDRSRNPE